MIELVFKSKDGKTITTFFINIVGIFLGTYIITSIGVITWEILRIRRMRRRKKLEKALPNVIRGGTDMELSSRVLKECLDEPGAYEIIGFHLKSAIRKILKNRSSKENLVIDRIVVLLASIVLSDIGTQLALTSPDFVAEQLKNKITIAVTVFAGVGVPLLVGALTAALPLPLKVAILVYTGALGTSGAVSYLESIRPVCAQHVRYLPELSKGSHFIDMAEHSNLGKIVMVTDEHIKLFITKDDDQVCTVEVLGEEETFFGKQEEIITQKCIIKKKYIPLGKRTKTMKDIRDGDSTQNLEKLLQLDLSVEESKAIGDRIQK
jgi:hypothetical protein